MSKDVLYNFRLKFTLPNRLKINSSKEEVLISNPNSKNQVILKAVKKDTAIDKSKDLVLIGSSYESYEKAEIDGKKWWSAAEKGFAQNLLGADFGERLPESFFTKEGLEWASKQYGGCRALHDKHGLMVYESTPKPIMVSVKAEAVVGKQLNNLISSIKSGLQKDVFTTEEERIAYDLFSASFFQPAADARLLLLMMAIETLLERKNRSEKARTQIDKLINCVKKSDLENKERSSIIGSLNDSKKESIGQAGRRFVESRTQNKYMDLTAIQLFTRCYETRSNLIHGTTPRQARSDVDTLAAELERMVGDILSFELTKKTPS